MLTGIITALITPMHDNGAIDYISLDKILKLQIEAKVAGIVLAGTTGEGVQLDDAEKLQLIKHVIAKVEGRVKVILGFSDFSTQRAIALVQKANNISGLDYLLIAVPPYIKPTQEGLYLHYSNIARNSTVPVILYNVPSRSIASLDVATTAKLSKECSNIVAIKDATGDMTKLNQLIQSCAPNFSYLSGDDPTFLPFMLCGGHGIISVASNLVPKLFVTMFELINTNRIDEAKAINASFLSLYNLLFIESNPIPIKWLVYKAGIISQPSLRLPLTVLSNANQSKMEQVLNNVLSKEHEII
jgi:4-hydroxy-tetrahydrodipicolinate synthase